MLAEEQARLHRLPDAAFTAAFGETRKVSWSSTISYGGVTYSVPAQLIDAEVWVRVDGDEVVATHVGPSGAVEVARHQRSTPGTPRIDDAHYPPRPAGPLNRQPKPTNAAEAEFLALGDGARMWLVEAATAGTARVKVKMADAVTLARLHGVERVDWALGHAATYGRFAEGDLASILAAHPAGEHRTRRRHPLAAGRHPRLGRLRSTVMTAATATSPPTRSSNCSETLRLPHMRRHAPDVLATAKAQRWEPAEAVRALLAEELAGRQASSINTRRAAAGFPTGKTFDTWDETSQLHPRADTTLPGHPRVDRPSREPRRLRTLRHRQDPTSSKPSATPPSATAATSSGSASKHSEHSCTATAPTAPPPERSAS